MPDLFLFFFSPQAHLRSEMSYYQEIAMRGGNTTPEWREKRKQDTRSRSFSIQDKLKKVKLVRSEAQSAYAKDRNRGLQSKNRASRRMKLVRVVTSTRYLNYTKQ